MKVEQIGNSNLAWVKTNFQKKTGPDFRQELNNYRYEGYMRGDFSVPRIEEYTYDLKIVRRKE